VRYIKSMLLVCLIGLAIVSCESNPPTTLPPVTPGGGFIIQSLVSYNGGPSLPEPDVDIYNQWMSDDSGAAGDPSAFTVITNALGLATAGGKRAPATWRFTWQEAADPNTNVCNGKHIDEDVALNETADVECAVTQIVILSVPTFSLYPNPVYISSPPSTGTVYGTGLTTTYGMPLVQYYTMDGTLAGQENANSVSPNGTSAQIAAFNVSQLPHGAYASFVSNAASGGTYTYIGNGAVNVSDGGVFIDGYEQSTDVCKRWLAGGDCSQWATYYDSGTVSLTINGVACSVSYNSNSTAFTIAIGLANAINANTSLNSGVQAIVAGTTVILNSRNGAQYSLSASSSTSMGHYFPDGPSFSASPSGSAF
jgi:hypothetical protein